MVNVPLVMLIWRQNCIYIRIVRLAIVVVLRKYLSKLISGAEAMEAVYELFLVFGFGNVILVFMLILFKVWSLNYCLIKCAIVCWKFLIIACLIEVTERLPSVTNRCFSWKRSPDWIWMTYIWNIFLVILKSCIANVGQLRILSTIYSVSNFFFVWKFLMAYIQGRFSRFNNHGPNHPLPGLHTNSNSPCIHVLNVMGPFIHLTRSVWLVTLVSSHLFNTLFACFYIVENANSYYKHFSVREYTWHLAS